MSKGLITNKQEQILNFIQNEIHTKGYPPTIRDICTAVHLKSTASVYTHLKKLEQAGYIRRDPTKPRAIEICNDHIQALSIPVVGRVAAGEPILAEQNIESYITVPSEDIPSGVSFALRVKGDSMINAGIFSGDLLLVQSCESASNGDIVVAMIDDSATVKRFFKEQDHIRLQPENDHMDPIIVDSCTILGKVFGVYRILI